MSFKSPSPKALYLLVLPFYAKALWGAFTAFALGYPRWARARAIAQGHLPAQAA